MASLPAASVIVATLDRDEPLVTTLEGLLAQDHPDLEVLVVDQSAAPAAAVLELAARHPDRIRHHHVRFRGLPRARNHGWQEARHDALIFVDDDVRCPPDLVRRHLEALAEPGVAMVAGGIDEPTGPPPLPGLPWFSRARGEPRGGFTGRGRAPAEHVKGCNFSVWRQQLEAVGGFDEGLSVGPAAYEELELCLRVRAAGGQILFDGEARLEHRLAPRGGCRVPDPVAFARGIGHSRGLLARRHLGPLERCTASLQALRVGVEHGWRAGAWAPVAALVRGFVQGYRRGARAPTCSPPEAVAEGEARARRGPDEGAPPE